jgi:hypothetical protein
MATATIVLYVLSFVAGTRVGQKLMTPKIGRS